MLFVGYKNNWKDYMISKKLQSNPVITNTAWHNWVGNVVNMDSGLKKQKKIVRYNRWFVITELIISQFSHIAFLNREIVFI